MAGILQTADYTQLPETNKIMTNITENNECSIEASILNLQNQIITRFPRQELLSALDTNSPLLNYFTTMLTDNNNTPFPSVYEDIPNDDNITKFQAGGESQILNLAEHIPGASDWPDIDRICDLNTPISELFPTDNLPVESPNNTVLSTPVLHRKISISKNSRTSRKTSFSDYPSEYNTNNLETPSKLALVSSPESQPSPYLSHPSQIPQQQQQYSMQFQNIPENKVNSNQNFYQHVTERQSAPESSTKYNFRKQYQSEMGINEFSSFNRNPNYQYFIDDSNTGNNSSAGGTGTVKKRKSFLQKVRNIFTRKSRNPENSSESIRRELSKSQQIYTNTEEISPEIKKGGRYSSFRSIGKKSKKSNKNNNSNLKQEKFEANKKYKSQNFEITSSHNNHPEFNKKYQNTQPAQFVHHGSMPVIAHPGFSPNNKQLRHPMHKSSKIESEIPLSRQAFGKYNFRTYTDDIEKIPISGLSPAVKIEQQHQLIEKNNTNNQENRTTVNPPHVMTPKKKTEPGFLYHSNIMSPPSPFTNPYNNGQ